MILVIDNYDSVHVQPRPGAPGRRRRRPRRPQRRDRLGAGVEAMADDPAADLRGIVISPGPGRPGRRRHLGRRRPGRRGRARSRCSASASGCSRWPPRSARSIVRAPTLVHGEASEVTHDGAGLLEGMPPAFMAARYHSLAVDPATLPPELRVTAMSEVDGSSWASATCRCRSRASSSTRSRVLTPAGPAPARELPAPGRRGRGVAARRRVRARSRRPGMAETADARRRVATGRPMSDLVRAALATIVDGGTLSHRRGARARWAR